MSGSARSTRSSRRAASQRAQAQEETIPEEVKEELMEEFDNADNNNNNDQMNVDEDGNESSSLGSMNDAMEDEQQDTEMSPSPDKKKDMHLRSGKRKRRRSRETTGLTPPEGVSERKKARRAGRSAKKASKEEEEEKAAAPPPTQQETIAEETKPADDDDSQEVPRKARDSILLSDNTALAAANQEPETNVADSVDDDDDGRRLFDSKPPAMPTTTATSGSQSPAAPAMNGTASAAPAETEQSKPQVDAPPEELEVPVPTPFNYSKLIWLGYIVLILVSVKVWVPLAGKLALAIVPLNEEALKLETPAAIEEPKVVVEEGVELPVPAEIVEGLADLERISKSIGGSWEGLESYKAELDFLLQSLKKNADVTKRKMMIRFSRLMEVERLLQVAIQDQSPEAWKSAREMVDGMRLPNKKMVDTSLIDLWQVEDPLECPDDDAQVDDTPVAVVEEKDPAISPRTFETTETNLLLRATMTAEKIVRSQKAEANVRAWVRDKIDTAIEDDDDILAALEHIQSMSPDDQDANTLSIEMIASLLQKRLTLEMADGTGSFDHAALMSGAKIIYGGKRGTSKSLTEGLPLYNRLMQLANLRFYGYGPEAAITPTYPKNALGQCWSFQPLPVKEQMKLDQKDDHKHGSFGTLTIGFANPVIIESISIEHPTATDHPESAIRGFRIIGFEDASAEGTGQPMGSFQYQLDGPSIQKYFVSEKGAMQSVSLAIDSNWGLEYACLYRFRVHGIGVEDED